MVTFNIHHGQSRCRAPVGTNDYRMERIAKRPMSRIQMGSIRNKDVEPVEYVADKLGNVECSFPKHLAAFQGQGWPIYIGNGVGPVAQADLLFPDMVRPEILTQGSPYERLIWEEIAKRKA